MTNSSLLQRGHKGGWMTDQLDLPIKIMALVDCQTDGVVKDLFLTQET